MRTAIGNYGGALQAVPAVKLGASVIQAALKKAGIKPKSDNTYAPAALKAQGLIDLEKKYAHWDASQKEAAVDEVIMGNVLQAGQGQNPARQAAIYAGVPKEVNAFTVNKICASGMKAVALAAQAIKAGDADIIVAGGIESMSGAPYMHPSCAGAPACSMPRWLTAWFTTASGKYSIITTWRHGGEYRCKIRYYPPGTGCLCIGKQQPCPGGCQERNFKDEIVPVEIKIKKETKLFEVDEHPRETSMELLGKLPLVFKADGGVTAGNASAITDAGAALVIMSASKAKELGLKPMAKIKAYACGGVAPAYMGLGGVPATKKVRNISGLSRTDMDVLELNAAFASQSIACARELGVDMGKTNLYGGGISLGHPIGCSAPVLSLPWFMTWYGAVSVTVWPHCALVADKAWRLFLNARDRRHNIAS